MPRAVDSPRAIAVLSLNHVGDVLFTTPAIAALKRRYPQARLIAITAAGVSAVLANNPNVQETLVRKTRRFPETWRLAAHLRQQGTDLVVDFSYSSFRLGLLAWLSGARRRIGLCRAPIRPFLTDCAHDALARHQIERCLSLVALVDADAELSSPQMFLTPEEAKWAETFLDSEGAAGEPCVGLNAGSSVSVKRWPAENYVALCDMLSQRGFRPILFGSGAEVPLADDIASRTRRPPVVAAGRTDLRQLAALISQCEAFVSGDSGPLHVATAVGVPAIGIYGPTDPRRFGPVGPGSTVLCIYPACCPCGHHPTCERIDCLRAVRPDEVLEAVLKAAGTPEPASNVKGAR